MLRATAPDAVHSTDRDNAVNAIHDPSASDRLASSPRDCANTE